MGLFFHQHEQSYTLRGTFNWVNIGKAKKQCVVKGTFFEREPNGFVKLIYMNCDDEHIYFFQNQNVKCLQLNLTVLEDHFYYNQHQSKSIENLGVYQIKLKKENLITIIFTENFDTFMNFYKHLAKYTILTCFQKHYKIIKYLGRGSSSQVYSGQNIFSKQQVAFKIFQKKSINPADDKNFMIANQIKNLEILRKFKLSPLIGVYQTSDCIILVLQIAEAGNMLDYLQSQAQNYNLQFIKNIIFKILQNIKQLHSAGLIHRDIKPENIFFNNFSSNSSLFLGDFGCSVMKKDVLNSRINRISSGTLGFMAPQIIKHQIYDQKCDLFSVGSIFYLLMNGQSLFVNKHVHQIYELVSDQKYVDKKINSLMNLNKSTKDLLSKLLKVDPQQRLTAEEAMNHQFFQNMTPQSMTVGEENYSLGQYIHKRVYKFFQ